MGEWKNSTVDYSCSLIANAEIMKSSVSEFDLMVH